MTMNYDEAIGYLQGLTKFGVNFGLGRIKELLRRLGDPHRRLNIVHIGGTNGKGSTTAMIASILMEAGYKVGMFTSPHLHSYTERFVINGECIAEAQLAQLITTVKPHLEAMVAEDYEHPTEFEVSTALALYYFAQAETDFVVLEVGLGGAIDSTNVVTPLVSVITNVTLDHMDYLGPRVEDIARVKAGIIKKGVPVVTAADGVALEIIKQVAGENNSKLIQVGQDITWTPLSSESEKGYQEFLVKGLQNHYHVRLPLLGPHQQINASTAIAAVEMLFRWGHHIPAQAVLAGLSKVRWPGRMEIIRQHPTVIIDGAHNHAGAVALRQALQQHFPHRDIILVLGMLADKERAKVVAELAPLARTVIVTRSNNPRAGDWTRLADYVKVYLDDVMIEENVTEAVKKAVSLAHQDQLVCITGSLYMIGEAREALGRDFAFNPEA